MSDYLSSIFLSSIVIVGILLLSIVLIAKMLRKSYKTFNIVVFFIVFLLLALWAGDRFSVGAFCFPWECLEQNVNIHDLLLGDADQIDDWVIQKTLNYTYDPRASVSYAERTFHSDSKVQTNAFYQEIYQYRSVRAASRQYSTLNDDITSKYSVGHELGFPSLNLSTNKSDQYVVECFYGSGNACFYVAQYEEFILVLEMPLKEKNAPMDEFIKLILLIDKKFSDLVVNKQNP